MYSIICTREIHSCFEHNKNNKFSKLFAQKKQWREEQSFASRGMADYSLRRKFETNKFMHFIFLYNFLVGVLAASWLGLRHSDRGKHIIESKKKLSKQNPLTWDLGQTLWAWVIIYKDEIWICENLSNCGKWSGKIHTNFMQTSINKSNRKWKLFWTSVI